MGRCVVDSSHSSRGHESQDLLQSDDSVTVIDPRLFQLRAFARRLQGIFNLHSGNLKATDHVLACLVAAARHGAQRQN